MFIALQRKFKSVSWFWSPNYLEIFFFFQRWAAKNFFHKRYALTCFGWKLATYRDNTLQYIPRLSLNKTSTVIDWFLVTCTWSNSNLSRPGYSFAVRHGLMLLWFTDLMNVTEEVTIHRPNVSTLLSSAFIRGDLNAATRGPFIWSLISCLFSDEV